MVFDCNFFLEKVPKIGETDGHPNGIIPSNDERRGIITQFQAEQRLEHVIARVHYGPQSRDLSQDPVKRCVCVRVFMVKHI